MLAQAESRGCHRHLHVADVRATGLPDAEYDLVACSLHLLGEHVAAARAAAFTPTELGEAVVDDEWIRRKPKWEAYRDCPISFGWVWAG